MTYVPALARVLLALVFLVSGFNKVVGFESLVGRLGDTGFPAPTLFAIAAVAVELGGAVLLIAGFYARYAALALAVFTVIATLLFHDFWAVEGAARARQTTQFLKNVAVLGGLLLAAHVGAGPLSADARRARGPVDRIMRKARLRK